MSLRIIQTKPIPLVLARHLATRKGLTKRKINPFSRKGRTNETFTGAKRSATSAVEEDKEIYVIRSRFGGLVDEKTKYWIYDRFLNVFHVGMVVFVGSILYFAYFAALEKYKIYKFTKKVAKDLADELGMEQAPLTFRKAKSPGEKELHHYLKPQEK